MAENQPSKPANAHSCVRCFKRKVKCDQQRPCRACIKGNVECVPRVPKPPRRRKERPHEDALIKRIEHYEALLRRSGVGFESQDVPDVVQNGITESAPGESSQLPTPGPSTSGVERQFTKSQVVYKHGQSKYVDNNIWTSAIEEIPGAGSTLGNSSSSEDDDDPEDVEDNTDFVLGLTPLPNRVKHFHPSFEHRSELWQAFVENVNSLLKIVHEPILAPEIKKENIQLENMPRNLEALMFSIYSVAVMSMTDDACVERFNESRKVLLTRYRLATKAALTRAKFLSTRDIVVLQAFFLHLISMRSVYGPHTTWTLMGIVGRLAEGMGMQCDGTYLGLPPFETEMRRRLWWQFKMLDAKFAELAGHARMKNINPDPQLTHMPSNVNDDQLYSGMLSFPIESEGFTDMCFCSLMSEFIYFWTTHAARMSVRHGKDASLWDNYGSKSDISENDQAIDELEQILQKKYVHHCDPTRPAQLITLIMARTATNHMHFIVHHPRRWGRDEDIPDSERQYVWNLATKQLETEITVRSNHQFDRFAWYLSSFFPWAQAIHILDCLRSNPLSPDAGKAWRLVGELFNHCPDLISNKKLIYAALGSLCLKAWNARTVALMQQGKSIGRTPSYIAALRSQQESANIRRKDREGDQRRRSTVSQSRVTSSGHMPSDSTWEPNTTLTSMDQISPETPSNASREDQYTVSTGNVNDEISTLAASINNPIAFATDIPLEQQDNYINDLNAGPIDWEQWDAFLQDWNGSFPGS